MGPTRTTDPSRNKTSQTLYDRIKIEVEKKVGESANALMSVSASALDSGAKGGTGGEAWLGQLQSTWKAFTEKMVSAARCLRDWGSASLVRAVSAT